MSCRDRIWRITRRAGAWPRWLLIEDVEADDFAVENEGWMFVLYVDTLVVDEPRRIVVQRLDARDVVRVERCGSPTGMRQERVLQP